MDGSKGRGRFGLRGGGGGGERWRAGEGAGGRGGKGVAAGRGGEKAAKGGWTRAGVWWVMGNRLAVGLTGSRMCSWRCPCRGRASVGRSGQGPARVSGHVVAVHDAMMMGCRGRRLRW